MKGLFQKFRVVRTDGRNEERDQHARYFVLNYVGDKHARLALTAYANSLGSENPELCRDIYQALIDTQADFAKYGLHHTCS